MLYYILIMSSRFGINFYQIFTHLLFYGEKIMNERLYIVKNGDGVEFEPSDEQTLVKWAETGKIDLKCKVRSTLVPNWDPAVEVPFLKPFLKKKLAEEVTAKHDTTWNRIKARMNLKVRSIEVSNGLVNQSASACPRADFGLRIAAALTDFLILGIYGVVLYLIFAWLYAHKVLGADSIFYIGFIIFWISTLIYYTFNISVKLQTPGQRFWGIFLVRSNGEDFWVGRVFFYTIFMFVFGIFSPLAIYASDTKRSLQEIFTKTRMAKLVFDSKKFRKN